MKKYFLVLLLSLFFLTGCSYRELNEIAIVSTLGVDYKENKFIISAQVIDFSKTETESENVTSTSILYLGEGATVVEALRDMYNKYPKNVHMAHLEIVILGNGVLGNHVKEVFDYLIRSPEATNDPEIVVNKTGTALEILNPEGKKPDSYNGKAIVDNLKQNQKHKGTVCVVNMEEFLSLYLQKGIDPVIPTIEFTKGKDDFSNDMLTGFTVFKDNALHKEIGEKEAIAYNIINANFDDIPITTTFLGEDVSILFLSPRGGVDLEVDDKGVKVNIKISGIGHISEIYEKLNLLDDKVLDKLSNNYEKTIKDYINSLLEYCKANDADVLGLKNMIYKKHNKFYKKYENDNIYEIGDINIDVDIDLFRHGTTYIGTVR